MFNFGRLKRLTNGRIFTRNVFGFAVFFLLISAIYVQTSTATMVPPRVVTATTEVLGGGYRRPSQNQVTMQQVAEIEALVTDLSHQLQGTHSRAEAHQILSVFLSRLSVFHLFSPTLHLDHLLDQAAPDCRGDQPWFNRFNNRCCFLVSYINGPNQDWNFFVLVGIVKLLMQGDPTGAYWLTYGNLKPLHLGQWYTQFAANSSRNESGLICSLGLFGLKIGNICKADPMVTMERFTGLKITFRIGQYYDEPFLCSKTALYIGYARSVYEGDIPSQGL